MARHTDPFPRQAVRDLLGIVRGLYRAERASELPDARRLEKLEEVGTQYRLALELGIKCEPDTVGGRAARGWAEKATATLGEVVAESALVASAVRATAAKLRRAR